MRIDLSVIETQMSKKQNNLQSIMQKAQELGQQEGSLPPVHLWNPPHCGDIGLRIQRNGVWYYGDSPIKRERLVRLFSTILRLDADNSYYLVTPVEKIVVHVEDVPFIAIDMDVEGSGATQILHFTTNVGDKVTAGTDYPLRFTFNEKNEPSPYVFVRHGLEALMSRSVFYALVFLGEVRMIDGKEQFGVWSDSVFFVLALAEDIEYLQK